MGFLRHAGMVAWKDLRIELRTREILSTTLFFAVMIVLVCSFAFVEKVPSIGDLAAAVVWIAVAFAGTLALGRAFDRELAGNTMRALLLAPSERGAIFLGKSVGVIATMLLVEAVVVPLVGFLFTAPVERNLHLVVVILVLATIAFAVVGSVFAGMFLPVRARDILLPVTLYPVVTPALIAGIKGTAALWLGLLPEASFWIKFLVVYDALFLVVSLWAFESLVVE